MQRFLFGAQSSRETGEMVLLLIVLSFNLKEFSFFHYHIWPSSRYLPWWESTNRNGRSETAIGGRMKRFCHGKERKPPEVAAENRADAQIETKADTFPVKQVPPVLPVSVDQKEKAGEESSDRSTRTSSGNEKSGEEVHEIQDENGETKNEKHDEVVSTDSTATASTEGEGPGEDDESKYPRALPLAILTLGLCLSTFVVALDNTIIATAIPRITTDFDSLNDVGWYGSSYLLTTTSLQPSFGKIYTYFNIKWTFITAVFIFEIGSILCAAAQSSTMLIVGRAVAGAGAAAIFSGGMTIIGYTVPLRKRPIYMGLLSSMFGISSIIGPILGGAFTDKLTWRCKYPLKRYPLSHLLCI
jgi:hypothetical protein